MKKLIMEQILEKCSRMYKEQDDKDKKEEEVEEKCKAYKECQCEQEQELQEAFFASNYK